MMPPMMVAKLDQIGGCWWAMAERFAAIPWWRNPLPASSLFFATAPTFAPTYR